MEMLNEKNPGETFIALEMGQGVGCGFFCSCCWVFFCGAVFLTV